MNTKLIDPKIPYNQLPQLPPDVVLRDLDILEALAMCNKALGELRGKASIFDENISYYLLMPLTNKEAIKSSNIENINSTMMSVLESEVLSSTEIKLSDKETISYRDCLIGGFNSLKSNEFYLNKGIIEEIQKEYLEIHRDLAKGFRKKRMMPNGSIGILRITDKSTKEILYTPPDDESILGSLLDNLCDYINDKSGAIDPILKICIAHYQFEAIHPFEDGNGRIGRIIFILSFLIHNELKIPVLYISGYLLDNKLTYYNLLNEVTYQNNWKGFIIFMLNGIRLQAKETQTTFEDIKLFVDETSVFLKKNKIKIRPENVIDSLSLSIKSLSKKADITYATSTKYLNKMVELGFLTEVKIGKERVFYSKKYFGILNSE